ncbi:hypothetical protein VMF7928_01401 [Vibrio marisflavi CECT 7928]|uniref:Uncharacterized protein n=1 Tax=Vibrio marisflavi CECT 7928 TaxID=634439 RepID=A0ABN8E3G0_9VIBR|nr:hypothetical protein VMF7928_01401 [Vibrio marisflavi CECT 7928]
MKANSDNVLSKPFRQAFKAGNLSGLIEGQSV